MLSNGCSRCRDDQQHLCRPAVGVEALAAVSIYFPIMILLILLVGLASGPSSSSGRPGAQEPRKDPPDQWHRLTVPPPRGHRRRRWLGAVLAPGDATARGPAIIRPRPSTPASCYRHAGLLLLLVNTSLLRGGSGTRVAVIALTCHRRRPGGDAGDEPGLVGLPPLGRRAAAIRFIIGFMVVLVFCSSSSSGRRSTAGARCGTCCGVCNVDWRLLGSSCGSACPMASPWRSPPSPRSSSSASSTRFGSGCDGRRRRG